MNDCQRTVELLIELLEREPSERERADLDAHLQGCGAGREMTRQNVRICKADAFEFLSDFEEPIKFCHIDASHDYHSVRRTIEMLLPRLVPGAILCGDDYLSANKDREDLDGGVERAVSELLEGHEHVRNFWYWRNAPRDQ